MKRLILLLVLLVGLLPLEANAIWFFKLIEAAADAGKVGSKVLPGPDAAGVLLKAAAASGKPASKLRIAGGNVVSTDAAGREAVLAVTAGGVLTLTDEGAAILRAVDLIIPEAELPGLAGFLKQAASVGSHKPIRLVREDGSLGRVLVRESNGQRILIAESYKGVFLEIAAEQTDELIWALRQPLHGADIKVVSLFDETYADVLRQLDDSVGNLHRPSGNISAEAVAATIRAQRQKSVFVVGHVEGDNFVVHDASGVRKNQIPIGALEAAAKEADSTIFMLGCSTGLCSMSSGPIVPVNAIKVASGLRQAIRQDTIGDALSVLSTSSGDMLIKPDIIDPVRMVMRAEEKTDALSIGSATIGSTITVRVGVLARPRAQELANRIIPMIPSWIQLPYLAGLVILVFLARRIRQDLPANRIPAPRFAYRPMTNIAVHGIRIGGFIVLMPFAATISVGMLFIAWFWSIASAIEIPVATAIAAVFGWTLWRMHREETAGEGVFRRFWIIVVFCAVVPTMTEKCLTLLHSNIDHESGSEPQWLMWAASALIAIAFSSALSNLLRRIGGNPNAFLNAIIKAPIALIEMAATRLITRTWRNEIAG